MSSSFKLQAHSHGKNLVRVMRVHRNGDRHDVLEMSVRVTVLSRAEKSFTEGDNSSVVPTDTIKNTVNITAKESTALSIELFALELSEVFLKRYEMIFQVRIEIESVPWKRVSVKGKPHPHGFIRTGPTADFVDLTASRNSPSCISSGIKNYIVLKTTQSGFESFAKCNNTSLPEVNDRILSTAVSASWSYISFSKSTKFSLIRSSIKETLKDAFFGSPETNGVYSPSVQKTLYEMGLAALNAVSDITSITLEMPNIHYIPMDLSRFGRKFDNDIYLPTAEPHGLIRATISRKSACRSRL